MGKLNLDDSSCSEEEEEQDDADTTAEDQEKVTNGCKPASGDDVAGKESCNNDVDDTKKEIGPCETEERKKQ